MIQQIKIENYKSITSLEMNLGRVNVLIGENGSGKTNILEAVAVGAAAEIDKLDNEYLSPRGIRMTPANLMRSGFTKPEISSGIIEIDFFNTVGENISIGIDAFNSDNLNTRMVASASKNYKIKLIDITPKIRETINELKKRGVEIESEEDFLILRFPEDYVLKNELEQLFFSSLDRFNHIRRGLFYFDKFLIFCPENTSLRRFEDEGQIRPLGIRGEGLFSHLADLARKEPTTFQKINEELQLIDWFGDFEIPSDLMFTEKRIRIRDRYLDEGIQYIDQRSSNEGFLFLLFYVTLFVSPHTPKFFAIDNIDNALNPKLCSELIKLIVKLAKENDKQVIVTAHNPGLLDGLNLNDEDQRLFVISRNKLGHTNALRIEHKPSTNGHEPVKLSEQFLRGYIGGLPKNF
jgi:predicted ATPase